MGEIEDLKAQGRKAFSEQNYREAAKIYGNAIAVCPSDAILYSNRSQCFLNLKDWTRALEDSDSGLQRIPTLRIKEKLLFRKAIAAKGLNNLLVALACLRQVLEIAPSNHAARTELDTIEKILGSEPHGASSKKLKTSSTEGQIPIEVVDELPDDFLRIVNPPQPSQPVQNRKSGNSKLVDQASQELFLGRPPKEQQQQQPSTNKQFGERPAMLRLRILDQLPQEKKVKAFETILSLTSHEILELGDVEPEFLELFVESATYAIVNNIKNVDDLLGKLKMIQMLPRFQIALLMSSRLKINNLYQALSQSQDQSLQSFKELLG